jgi:Methyltransferase domain
MDLAEARERNFETAVRHPWETARLEVIRRLVAAHVPVGRGSIVLDVGCGDTYVAEQLGAAYPTWTFFAIDTAFTDDLIARYGGRLKDKNVTPYRSLESLPPLGRAVALVLLMDVIEHVADDRAFLRDLAGRPYVDRDTRFLVTVPAYQFLFSAHDRFLGHYRRYSNRSLKTHVEDAGLAVEAIGYFFFSLLPIRWMQAVKERVLGGGTTTGLVTWQGSRRSAEIMEKALVMDATVSAWLKRGGLTLPGLSNYAICRKSA